MRPASSTWCSGHHPWQRNRSTECRTTMFSHAHSSPQKPARVVVLGSGGFLGKRLLETFAAAGIACVGLGSKDVDLADGSAGVKLAQQLRPKDVLVFLSALTPDKGR